MKNIQDVLLVMMFSATLLCSASLMFLIQPLIGKLLLPKLGGGPQVWNTCMVFFQIILFAGYLHAHYSGRLFGLRGQAILHLCLAFATLLYFPIGVLTTVPLPDADNPIPWLMQTLFVSVGAPLFVLSSTAPLLQKWFSHTRHPDSQNPYFLYAASNLGSLIALVSYPTIVEPILDLGRQLKTTNIGFSVLVIGLVVCALLFYWNGSSEQSAPVTDSENDAPVTGSKRIRWLLLSFTPSSLLLGVTTYITTDIAAAPLFWMVPLVLYLATFVLVFSRRWNAHDQMLSVQGLVIPAVTLVMLASSLLGLLVKSSVHLIAFFVTALVCHGELVRSRPQASHLTEFYLWMSLGGALGGVFNALVAPVVFSEPLEYPLVLALACFLRPHAHVTELRDKLKDVLYPLALLTVMLLAMYGLFALVGKAPLTLSLMTTAFVICPASVIVFRFRKRPVRFGLSVAVLLIGFLLLPRLNLGVGSIQLLDSPLRSFFGIYRLYYNKTSDLNVLMHGTTVHGAQSRDPALALEPRSYYHRGGPFGDLFEMLQERLRGRHVALVGLGAGALTCYGEKGNKWTYYELDPLVEQIAKASRHFTYLRDCPPDVDVKVGDARLTLGNSPDNHYTLIVVDAFSSDSIPTHLLTREAIAGYLAKLSTGGVIAFHVSNRHMNLEPVVANLAKDAGLVGRINRDKRGDETNIILASSAEVIVLARQDRDLGTLASDNRWRALKPRDGERLWSDDYVNILSVLGGKAE